jgi:tRNA/tmRNA/rRNA uracil-C5-methylase (TrmA/RlmC/RlmD family)
MTPKCAVFGICGGCSFQYLSSADQIDAKGKWLKDAFQQQAKTEPKNWLEPLQVEDWGYRRKARLGVRFVVKKDKVLVGFREKKSGWIANMDRCEVLHPSIGQHLVALGSAIEKLSIKSQVPQNEQPPQIPNTAHFGVMRLGEASNTSLTCASSNLAREKHRSAITVSPGNAPLTKITFSSRCAMPRPSCDNDSISNS